MLLVFGRAIFQKDFITIVSNFTKKGCFARIVCVSHLPIETVCDKEPSFSFVTD
jgi:hypothetical protein